MHRQHLIALLKRYRDVHPAEAESAEKILSLAKVHADCFDRTCAPGHITASAWIVSSDLKRFLMGRHRKLGRWLQLGGHADGDPDGLRVALREAREESGMQHFSVVSGDPLAAEREPSLPLDLDIHRIPAFGDEPEHEHHDLRFLLIAGPGQSLSMSNESTDLAWFERGRLEALGSDESVMRLARKAETRLAGLGAGETS